MDLMIEIRSGSHLNVTDTPDSDLDFKSVYLPDGIMICGRPRVLASWSMAWIRLLVSIVKRTPFLTWGKGGAMAAAFTGLARNR